MANGLTLLFDALIGFVVTYGASGGRPKQSVTPSHVPHNPSNDGAFHATPGLSPLGYAERRKKRQTRDD